MLDHFVSSSKGILVIVVAKMNNVMPKIMVSWFLCQLTCQSVDIMASLRGVRVHTSICVNNFSKSARPRDMVTLSIEDDILFNACRSLHSPLSQELLEEPTPKV